MKFLIFDVDKSLAAIGGDAGAETLSGVPPVPINGGALEIMAHLRELFEEGFVKVKHPLFDVEHTRKMVALKSKAKDLKLDGIVIDSISHLFRQDMRILEAMNKGGSLEMQDWGKLERYYNGLVSFLVKLPVWVIVTSHATYDKDQNLGTLYFAPNVKGSTKDSLAEYFDCVFFTKASKDGKKIYTWQTFADASKFGKDRLGVLPPIIQQDFIPVLSAYHEAKIEHPKILIIGESGTGKTKSLASINKQQDLFAGKKP